MGGDEDGGAGDESEGRAEDGVGIGGGKGGDEVAEDVAEGGIDPELGSPAAASAPEEEEVVADPRVPGRESGVLEGEKGGAELERGGDEAECHEESI